MSPEKPPENILDQERLNEALAESPLNRNSAEPFLREMIKRNTLSQRQGETDYFEQNVNQTLNQYNLSGPDATPYRSLAGKYFGGHSSQSDDGTAEQISADKKILEQREATAAEILHSEGEEAMEKFLKEQE